MIVKSGVSLYRCVAGGLKFLGWAILILIGGYIGAQTNGSTSETKLSATGNGYRVVALTERLSFAQTAEAASWWGSTDRHPKVVKSVRITHGAVSITVPRSAFADLANVSKVWVSATKRGCIITLQGGDAAESYTAVISIRDNLVVERKVTSDEEPGDREETRYSFRPRRPNE